VDFDGIADGRAIRNCLSNVKPRKLILVHGTSETTAELVRFVESSIKSCEAVKKKDMWDHCQSNAIIQ
jgi:cleavage and polyadenylation specificity factor subunit 2